MVNQDLDLDLSIIMLQKEHTKDSKYKTLRVDVEVDCKADQESSFNGWGVAVKAVNVEKESNTSAGHSKILLSKLIWFICFLMDD